MSEDIHWFVGRDGRTRGGLGVTPFRAFFFCLQDGKLVTSVDFDRQGLEDEIRTRRAAGRETAQFEDALAELAKLNCLDHLQRCQEVWVGLWRGQRHVVFDPLIQPDNSEFILLYFVEGRALCARKRANERYELSPVSNPRDRDFALEQYCLWRSTHAHIAAEKKARRAFEEEYPPPARKKCPDCDCHTHWSDLVNKPRYEMRSELTVVAEPCPSCKGEGFVRDVFES
ncbi:hypothetical protein [Rhodocyclus purpureus]|uniref:hypothetical protein n=1 Tax=Rhodocyclus purpureus TaxID=1067 RepID=UPI00191373B2|nr:hypothetical protein [Rhodocyclus purpureus]MBK5913733.1 hypothetical protein [Rhodocyclus purpureus]